MHQSTCAVCNFALFAGAHVAYTLFMEYIAPAHRGQCMSLIEGFWTLGSIHLAGMAWAILPDLGWRALVLVAAAPLLCLVVVYPMLKESPHWLLVNDRPEDALVGHLDCVPSMLSILLGRTSLYMLMCMQAVLQWAAHLNGKELPPGALIHHSQKTHSLAIAQGSQHEAVYMQQSTEDTAATAATAAPGNGCGPAAHSVLWGSCPSSPRLCSPLQTIVR